MAQLVGQNCVFCQARISNDLDAGFCPQCREPSHRSCRGSGAEGCSGCGAVAASTQPATGASGPVPPRTVASTRLVSSVCPQCSSTRFKTIRPKKLVSFVQDRCCKECKTEYSPPTPVWAGFVFLGAGGILTLAGVVGVGASLLVGNVKDLTGIACAGFVGVLGIFALRQGFLAITTPGKV